LKKLIRQLINSQKYLSQKFDTLLPENMIVFANDIFDNDVLPQHLKNNFTIYDIGGGKHPNISIEQKTTFTLNVVGFDISSDELDQAPQAIYDQTITADITQYNGLTEGDVIICRALLEHVPNVFASLKNIEKMTKPGGDILIFGPCKNALFSRINMMLPDNFKRKLLNFAFPSQQKRLGFTAYYDQCSPKEFIKIAHNLGLEVSQKHISYNSQYFSIFAPLHILWRLYQLIIRAVGAENFCEAYVLVLHKPN
jgi:ubiquinone/menaquinone biosynthesis C-methylase UbiE